MTYKLKAKVKADLLHALRSGEYKKTMGRLRRGNCFCIWGVICNLHAKAHPEIAAKQTDKGMYMGSGTRPAGVVQKWAGITDTTCLRVDGAFRTLIGHNDRGVSFKKLADAIEKQL